MSAPVTAPFFRRVVALFIDWTSSSLLVGLFFNIPAEISDQYFKQLSFERSWLVMDVFIGSQILFIWLFGYTLGQRLLGLRVVSLTSKRPSLLRVAYRTLLLVLIVPAFITDSASRGLHDRAAKTAIIRR